MDTPKDAKSFFIICASHHDGHSLRYEIHYESQEDSKDSAEPSAKPNININLQITNPINSPTSGCTVVLKSGVIESKVKLSKYWPYLKKSALAYAKNRKETVNLLRSLADELSTHHRNAEGAKIAGGAAGLVASGLVIAGFVASFFTFGASLGLVAGGAAVGAAGGLTAVGGFMAELISSKLTGKKAKEILQRDNDSCDSFIAALARVNKSYTDLLTAARISGGLIGSGKQVFNIVDSVTDLVKVSTLTLDAADTAGQTAFKAATAAGKGAAIAGVVISVVTVPFALYMIISSAKYLRNKTIPQVAQEIYSCVEEMDCPSESEMSSMISEIERQLSSGLETQTT